ncbi:MAG TPA: hypothetical protein VK605_09740, partial [Solirubrobacteraceae bacterium]|nr:hypothetical protein [Solirubrobacteraceae bacterium]
MWRAAAICAVPFVLLTAFYCLRPRFYFTGTDSVENDGAVVEAKRGSPVCAPGLRLPAGTAAVRLQVTTPSSQRSALRLTLRVGG